MKIFDNGQFVRAARSLAFSGVKRWCGVVLLPSAGICWKLLRPYSSSTMVSVVDFRGTLLICFRQTQTRPLKAKVFLFKETWGWGREGRGYNSYLSSLICLQTAESFKFYIQKPPNIKMSAELIKYLSTDNCWSVWISEAWIKGIEGQEREDHISNCSVKTQL